VSVLVAVTDSPEGDLALSAAAGEAERMGTDLLALNLELVPLDVSALPASVRPQVLPRTPGLTPSECVLAALHEHRDRVERLVIGVRRRSPVGKAVLGSLSQDVLLTADVPVLAVKLPADWPVVTHT